MSDPPQDHVPARLWVVLAGLALVWGCNWTAMKVAISEIAPLTFRTVSLVLGSGILFGVLRLAGQPLTVPRKEWPRLAVISFFTITCWNLLVILGLATIPSGRAAIIAYTMPAWSIPLSVLALGDRMSARKVLGLALGMAAMALLLSDEFTRLQGAPVGALLVLGAAITWAIGTVLQKRYPVSAPPGAYTAWIMLVGGLPIYIAAFLLEDVSRIAHIGAEPALALAYNVILAFAWAHWAWIKLATSMSVAAFSLSMLVVPVVGVFSSALFFHTTPGWTEIGALLLVIASLATVIAPAKRAA